MENRDGAVSGSDLTALECLRRLTKIFLSDLVKLMPWTVWMWMDVNGKISSTLQLREHTWIATQRCRTNALNTHSHSFTVFIYKIRNWEWKIKIFEFQSSIQRRCNCIRGERVQRNTRNIELNIHFQTLNAYELLLFYGFILPATLMFVC